MANALVDQYLSGEKKSLPSKRHSTMDLKMIVLSIIWFIFIGGSETP